MRCLPQKREASFRTTHEPLILATHHSALILLFFPRKPRPGMEYKLPRHLPQWTFERQKPNKTPALPGNRSFPAREEFHTER